MLKRPPASRGGPAAYFDHVRALVIDTDWPPLPPPVTSHAATSTSSTAARLAWLHARCRYRLGGRRRPWYGVPFHGSGPPAVAATFRRPRFLVQSALPVGSCPWLWTSQPDPTAGVYAKRQDATRSAAELRGARERVWFRGASLSAVHIAGVRALTTRTHSHEYGPQTRSLCALQHPRGSAVPEDDTAA